MCSPFASLFRGHEHGVATRGGGVSDNSAKGNGGDGSVLNTAQIEGSDHSGLQIAFWIGYRHFNRENTIFFVGAGGNARDSSFVLFRIILQVDCEFLAQAQLPYGVLWNTEANLHGAGVSNGERYRSGRRQVAEFNVAGKDVSGKRRREVGIRESQLRLVQSCLRLIHSTERRVESRLGLVK